MNLRRGLFRVWVLLSIVWFGVVTFVAYQPVREQFERSAVIDEMLHGENPTIVVLCDDARGQLGVDYSSAESGLPGPWDKYADKKTLVLCYYRLPAYRAAYPEDAGLSDEALLTRGFGASPGGKPWGAIMRTALVAFGGSLAALLLGIAVLWAIAGFAKQEPPLAR